LHINKISLSARAIPETQPLLLPSW